MKYIINDELDFFGIGSLTSSAPSRIIVSDKQHRFDGSESVEINSVQVVGWNTRVTFTVLEITAWQSKHPHPRNAFKGLVGYVDFKNENYEEESWEVKATFKEIQPRARLEILPPAYVSL